jgi:hypothetical protein
MPNTRLVCVDDQPNAAISGDVKLLHAYAVPAMIMTRTPANAIAQRLPPAAVLLAIGEDSAGHALQGE